MYWGKEKVVPPSDKFYNRAPAADIELTAYALMTYILQAKEDSSLIGQAMPIVRWLTKQRNALGGFASTQVSRVHRARTLFEGRFDFYVHGHTVCDGVAKLNDEVVHVIYRYRTRVLRCKP